jgi:hypothetical protein
MRGAVTHPRSRLWPRLAILVVALIALTRRGGSRRSPTPRPLLTLAAVVAFGPFHDPSRVNYRVGGVALSAATSRMGPQIAPSASWNAVLARAPAFAEVTIARGAVWTQSMALTHPTGAAETAPFPASSPASTCPQPAAERTAQGEGAPRSRSTWRR